MRRTRAYNPRCRDRLAAPSGPVRGLRYIGSGEAASYRRLPPLGPTMASSRHVPLPVLRGPVSAPSVELIQPAASFVLGAAGPGGPAAGGYARFDRRGYATLGSVSTFTSAGFPL